MKLVIRILAAIVLTLLLVHYSHANIDPKDRYSKYEKRDIKKSQKRVIKRKKYKFNRARKVHNIKLTCKTYGNNHIFRVNRHKSFYR